MDLGLKGKVALVAASSRGLGFAVAEELAAEGASIVMCSRSSESIQSAGTSIAERFGPNVLAISGDLSESNDVQRVFDRGIEKFGRIDILVTNAGGPPAGKFANLGTEAWEEASRTLLKSVLDLTRLVLPGMKQHGWGRILNITSIAVKQPVDDLILSNSLRAAVTGFAKTLANEVAADGITVNNILPGYTATERVKQLAQTLAEREGSESSKIVSRWESEIPMRRLGTPKEFAALAAFLVSERASYITGTSIPVDGGWTRSLF